MTEYVARGEHLKLCMNLLKDDRKMVQYEGFHVFKVRSITHGIESTRLQGYLGIRGKPKQIASSTENTCQQPRPTLKLLAQVPGRSNR